MKMLNNNDIKNAGFIIWLLPLLISLTILFLYEAFSFFCKDPFFPDFDAKHISVILGITTTFSITMTGFIAAIGAYLLSISRSVVFNRWRNHGYLEVFFKLYGASILCLLGTFLSCILTILFGNSLVWLKITLSLLLVNIMHILTITYAVINQFKYIETGSNQN